MSNEGLMPTQQLAALADWLLFLSLNPVESTSLDSVQ